MRKERRTLGATQLLVVIAVLYTLYVARPILVPVVVSLLLSFLLAPGVAALVGSGVPRWLSSAVVVVALLAAVGGVGYALSGPVQRWLEEAPRALARAEVRIQRLLQPMDEVGRAADQVEEIAGGQQSPADTVQVEDGGGFRSAAIDRLRSGLGGAVVVVGLVYFFLSWGPIFQRKLARVVHPPERRRTVLEIAARVQRDVSTYLLTMTGINVVLGMAVAGAMALLGMPNPLLWGVLAALLNYVPYFGALVGMAVMGLVGLTVFEEPGRAILVAGVYGALTGLEGNVLKPMILGRRLTLNPVAIFVGLLFWGWIWGVVGALMAVPLLSALKLCCDQYEPLAPLGTFLGR